MADQVFSTAMAKRGIKGLRQDRQAVIILFAEIEERVTELPMELSSVADLEDEIATAKIEIANVRSLNRIFVRALLDEGVDVEQSEGYKLDQKTVRDSIKALEQVIKTCKTNLIDAGFDLVQPNVAQVANEDLAALILELKNSSLAQADASKANADAIKALSDANADTIKSLVVSSANNAKISNDTNSKVMQKLITKNQAPKMIQPKFSPTNSVQDYRDFREFLSNFEAFLKDVKDHKDRLRWLRTCVKGKAFDLIEGFSIKGENYNLALRRLKDEYLSSLHIKNSIFDVIYNWKNAYPDKLYTNVRDNLVTLENHLIELKDTYGLDYSVRFCQEYLAHCVLRNIPAVLRNGLFDKLDKLDPSLEEIFRSVQEVIKKVNLQDGHTSPYPKKSDNIKNSNKTVGAVNINNNSLSSNSSKSPKKIICKFCGGKHTMTSCPTYTTIVERQKQLNKSGLCSKCAASDHKTNDCENNIICNECEKTHPKDKFHLRPLCPRLVKKSSNAKSVAAISSKMFKPDRSVALPLMSASIDCRGKEADKAVAMLLDTGSQATLVKRSVVNRLGLPLEIGKVYTSLQGYAGQKVKGTLFDTINFKVYKKGYKDTIIVKAYVVDNLVRLNMPGLSRVCRQINKKGITLAYEPILDTKQDSVEVELLVGNDLVNDFIDWNQKPIRVKGQFLLPTIYGMAASGPVPRSFGLLGQKVNAVTIANVSVLGPDEEIDDNERVNAREIIDQLSNMENIGINVSDRQKEDVLAYQQFKATITYDKMNNQFSVGFPWRFGEPPKDLPDNKHVVLAAFKSMMKSLDKSPEKRLQYQKLHDSEVAANFIEPITESEVDKTSQKHFLMHFPVYKKDPQSTTPVRRVFNGSLAIRNGISLNDCMLKGQSLTPHIAKVLLRLRLKQYLLTSDVSKAFLRVVLRECDRNYTLFFIREDWTDPESKILIFRFRTVLFGSTSSPFLLNSTILEMLEQFGALDTLIEIYVDNIFATVDTNQELLDVMEESIKLFEKASMPLHEFASNSEFANGVFQAQGIFTKSQQSMKTLGYHWDFTKDTWAIEAPEFNLSSKVSKRTMLSDVSAVFDPLGLIMPPVLQSKALIQKCWDLGVAWDAEIPDVYLAEWQTLVQSLKGALHLEHKRWFGIKNLNKIKLHIFSDASNTQMGCAAYVSDEQVNTLFITKGKICPIKNLEFTIARKEMVGILMACRLTDFIVDACAKYFEFESIHLWSDSQVCLSWLTSKNPHTDIFVRNRVGESRRIAEKLNIKFLYIISEENPADIITKYRPGALESKLWREGPDIIRDPSRWKVFVPGPTNTEEVPLVIGQIAINPSTYSIGFPSIAGLTTLDEIYQKTLELRGLEYNVVNVAEIRLSWFREVQEKYFSDVIVFLKHLNKINYKVSEGRKIVRDKKLKIPDICNEMTLFLDDRNIIRVRTSLEFADNIPEATKFPALLNKNDLFTKILINDCHVQSGHLSEQGTINEIKKLCKIPKLTTVVKSVVRGCRICRLDRGRKFSVPLSPQMKKQKLGNDPPFSFCGVDMAGPFNVKLSKEVHKRWVILFTCGAIRAVHLEVVQDCSAEAFANCFLRFVARRGTPKIMISDNGSNFKLFSKDLLDISKNSFTTDTLVKKGVEWEFLPVRSPWMGGFFERLIGVMKTVLRKTFPKKIPDSDAFQTSITITEGLVNNRPIHFVLAGDDIMPLTPNYLFFGRNLNLNSNIVMPDTDETKDPDFLISSPDNLGLRGKRLKNLMVEITRRWQDEYLVALYEKDSLRQKSGPGNKYRLQANEGDIVQIVGEDKDQLGRILKLIKSHDGNVRSAQVFYKGRVSIHPLKNMRHVESAFENNLLNSGTTLFSKYATESSSCNADTDEVANGSNIKSNNSSAGEGTETDFLSEENSCIGKSRRVSARLAQKKNKC